MEFISSYFDCNCPFNSTLSPYMCLCSIKPIQIQSKMKFKTELISSYCGLSSSFSPNWSLTYSSIIRFSLSTSSFTTLSTKQPRRSINQSRKSINQSSNQSTRSNNQPTNHSTTKDNNQPTTQQSTNQHNHQSTKEINKTNPRYSGTCPKSSFSK